MAGEPEDSWEVGEMRFLGLRPRRAALVVLLLLAAAMGAAVIAVVLLDQLLIAVFVGAGLVFAVVGFAGWLPSWNAMTGSTPTMREPTDPPQGGISGDPGSGCNGRTHGGPS